MRLFVTLLPIIEYSLQIVFNIEESYLNSAYWQITIELALNGDFASIKHVTTANNKNNKEPILKTSSFSVKIQ